MPDTSSDSFVFTLISEYAQRHGLGIKNNSLSTSQQSVFFTHFQGDEFLSLLPYCEEIIPAVLRLLRGAISREKICIYCDYDTDAVTAGAVMYWGLILLGYDANCITLYTPDRFREGYGINQTALIELAAINDIIISVDCGINSVQEVAAIKDLQCDVIITDHHQLTGVLPPAYAVVNPQTAKFTDYIAQRKQVMTPLWQQEKGFEQCVSKQVEYQYMSESVTGVGVAWFVIMWMKYVSEYTNIIHATNNTIQQVTAKDLALLLPYVAIGTIADCQSVTDTTNRSLIKAGLTLLQKQKYIGEGFGELLQQTGFIEKMSAGYVIGSQDLAFVFSPLLNSSGRMTHASHSIALVTYNNGHVPVSPLLADQYSGWTPQMLAADLITVNNERKQSVKDIVAEVDTQVIDQINRNTALIWLEGVWSKGIIGLIASRIVSQTHKPVIVFSRAETQTATHAVLDTDDVSDEEVILSASLRAPKGYNLALAIKECMPLLKAGGGHPGAAGLSLNRSNQAQFYELFESIIRKQADAIGESDNYNQYAENGDVSGVLSGTRSIAYTLFDSAIVNTVELESTIVLEDENLLYQLGELIQTLEPFGQHFPFPKILVRLHVQSMRTIGKDNNHIKFSASGIMITQFYSSQELLAFISAQSVQAVSEIEMVALLKTSYNTWNGATKLEFIAERVWIEDTQSLYIS